MSASFSHRLVTMLPELPPPPPPPSLSPRRRLLPLLLLPRSWLSMVHTTHTNMTKINAICCFMNAIFTSAVCLRMNFPVCKWRGTKKWFVLEKCIKYMVMSEATAISRQKRRIRAATSQWQHIMYVIKIHSTKTLLFDKNGSFFWRQSSSCHRTHHLFSSFGSIFAVFIFHIQSVRLQGIRRR